MQPSRKPVARSAMRENVGQDATYPSCRGRKLHTGAFVADKDQDAEAGRNRGVRGSLDGPAAVALHPRTPLAWRLPPEKNAVPFRRLARAASRRGQCGDGGKFSREGRLDGHVHFVADITDETSRRRTYGTVADSMIVVAGSPARRCQEPPRWSGFATPAMRRKSITLGNAGLPSHVARETSDDSQPSPPLRRPPGRRCECVV